MLNEKYATPKAVEDFINEDRINSSEFKTLEEHLYVFTIFTSNNKNHILSDENELTRFERDCNAILGPYFGKLKLLNDNFNYQILNNYYKDKLWEANRRYRFFNKLSSDEFEKVMQRHKLEMHYLLSDEKIVKNFKNVIKQKLLSNPLNFEYFLKIHNDSRQYYLPDNISVEDINQWGSCYCDDEKASLNFLDEISNWGKHHEIKLKDDLRLKAEKKLKDKWDNLEKDIKSFYVGMTVKFDSDMNETIRSEVKGLNVEYIVNKQYLIESQQSEMILNNFKNIFGAFDKLGYFSLLPRYNSDFQLLDIFEPIKIKEYPFRFDNDTEINISIQLFYTYYNFLKEMHIDLEQVFKWYFEEYLFNEFNIENFTFKTSNPNTSYYNRILFLLPQMDGIIKKQFLLREKGEIDIKLYEKMNDIVEIINLKSHFNKKNIYIKSESLNQLVINIFSTKGSFSYVENSPAVKASNCYNHIMNNVNYNNLFNRQKDVIDKMIDRKIINKNKDGTLKFNNLYEISLFKYLYEKGYINFCYFNDTHFGGIINDYIESGDLEYDNKLFSKNEINLLDYLLNDKQYNNSKGIRNKYIHGSNSEKSEEQYLYDYNILLMILYLYIERIDEELNFKKQYTKLNRKGLLYPFYKWVTNS